MAPVPEERKTFYPYGLFDTAVTVFLIIGAVLAMAWLFPVELGDRADPTDTSFVPRPEWYFAFAFQLLKYFPGALEPVATVFVPVAGVLLFALVPFLDRNPERRARKRPWAVGLAFLLVAGIGFLTFLGLRA